MLGPRLPAPCECRAGSRDPPPPRHCRLLPAPSPEWTPPPPQEAAQAARVDSARTPLDTGGGEGGSCWVGRGLSGCQKRYPLRLSRSPGALPVRKLVKAHDWRGQSPPVSVAVSGNRLARTPRLPGGAPPVRGTPLADRPGQPAARPRVETSRRPRLKSGDRAEDRAETIRLRAQLAPVR
ncbi:unnamed protein product [Lampetra fluviatilis]